MTRPTDHAGLAALARALADHRDATGCGTRELRGAAGVVYLASVGNAVCVADHTGTVASASAAHANTALRALADALDRLAAQHPPALCPAAAATDRLCARIAEASAQISASVSSWLACPAEARCGHLAPDVCPRSPHGMRIWGGLHFARVAHYGGAQFEATAHLRNGMTFAAAVGRTAEDALTRLRDTLARETAQ